MSIEDGHDGVPGHPQLDPIYSGIMFSSPSLKGKDLQLHPLQINSTDDIVKNSTYDSSAGSFTVPSRITSVFVEPRVS
ncbi:UNVERIFIED_CONTAM: hypothetical protein Slati_4229500 [Sesamum latifolium]|uniref:Alpha-1,6-glucosidases pullulanase-type C-terminal domain-containing protein n=1 Tax=Sesamum latifolium TaxID=2727402 RepID=A0AAW2TE49_9LAMI